MLSNMRHEIRTFRKVLADNGLLNTINIFSYFLLQNYFGFPARHVYTIKSKMFDKKIKFVFDLNKVKKRNWALFDVFTYYAYYKSKNDKLVFPLDNNSCVLDIGAFIGDTAVFFAMQGAKVYAYEPQRKAFEMVIENAKINNFKKVHAFNNPITSNGRKLFAKSSDSASLSFDTNSKSAGEEINSIRLSEVLDKEKTWDIVKIDIEGGEWELINYLNKHSDKLNKIKAFIFEIHRISENEKSFEVFLNLLKKKKFQIEIDRDKNQGMLWCKKN